MLEGLARRVTGTCIRIAPTDSYILSASISVLNLLTQSPYPASKCSGTSNRMAKKGEDEMETGILGWLWSFGFRIWASGLGTKEVARFGGLGLGRLEMEENGLPNTGFRVYGLGGVPLALSRYLLLVVVVCQSPTP